MKNKWRFFAVTLAVVLCMTVFSGMAYAGGGDIFRYRDEYRALCTYLEGKENGA